MLSEMVSFIDLSKEILLKLQQGVAEVSSNVKVLFGILTNVQARTNSVLITMFLVLWVKQYYPKPVGEEKDQGYSRAMFISGVSNVIGMISAVLFGFVYEKANISVLLTINNACILAGYTMLCFVDPTNGLVFLAMGIAAFGFYGLTTVGFIIVNKNCGCRARGAVMGLNCLAGAIGILILSKLGGFLFDTVWNRSPFIISAFYSFMMIIAVWVPAIKRKLLTEERE